MRNFVNLPVRQKKILASLKVENDIPALELQEKLTADLFKLYSTGQDSEGNTASVSGFKASTYQTQFIAIKKKINELDPNRVTTQAEQHADNQIINYTAYKRKSSVSDFVFKKMSWFHAIRLFSVRGKNLGEKIYNFIMNEVPKYLPPTLSKGISWLGALYGINLVVDLITLGNIVLRKPRPGEPNLSRWQRLKDAMTRERCSRMFNDVLWTITNIIGILVTGGSNILLTVGIITVGAFFLDVVNETTVARLGYRDHTQLLKAGKNCQADEKLPQQSINLINTLVEKQSIVARHNTIRAFVVFTFVALAAIPGAFPIFQFIKQPIISLISSSISFVAGSLFAGLGRKILLKVKDKYAAMLAKKKLEEAAQLTKSTPNNSPGNAPVLKIQAPVSAPASIDVAPISLAAAPALIQASPDPTQSDTVIKPSKTLFTEAQLRQTMSKKQLRHTAKHIVALDLATPNTSQTNMITRHPSYVIFPNLSSNQTLPKPNSPQNEMNPEIHQVVSGPDDLPVAEVSVEKEGKFIDSPLAFFNRATSNEPSNKYIAAKPRAVSVSVC